MYKAGRIVNKASQILAAVAILSIALGAAPTLLRLAEAANPPISGTPAPEQNESHRLCYSPY